MDHATTAHESTKARLLDWLLVIAAPAIALPLLRVNPDSHTFDVLSLSLSHPHREQPKVPLWLLILLAVFSPIAVITTVALRNNQRTWRKRAQVLNNALLGLGVSLAISTIVLNIQNLAGKPRPDFLAICKPDLARIGDFTVGGYGASISPLWVMVDRRICTGSPADVNAAFRSFPSGFATIAFAGLAYLSLWLSAQYAIVPFGPWQSISKGKDGLFSDLTPESVEPSPSEDIACLQPLYFLILPLTPLGIAIFIAGTRYFDFINHGVDVAAGAAAGLLTAYVGLMSCHSWLNTARGTSYRPAYPLAQQGTD